LTQALRKRAEEGEIDDEAQEAEEEGGEENEQAGPSLPAVDGGGGCACSFSSTPVDRAPAKRERKMSDEEQREVAKRSKSPWQHGMDVMEDVQQAEQHSSGGEGITVMRKRHCMRHSGWAGQFHLA
jgi:hypothetical protein